MKNLGANVGVNVYYPFLRGEINRRFIGKDRAFAASRLKSMVDAGLVVALHTDTPVAPPRPIEEIWIACCRVAEKEFSSGSEERSETKGDVGTHGVSNTDK